MIVLFLLVGFAVGERLEYNAKFGFLNLGTMILETKDTIQYGSRPCYVLSSILSSNPSLNFLFSLHDTIEVYTEIDAMLPVSYEKRQHEGKYHNQFRVFFDRQAKTAIYDDTLQFNIADSTMDLLTFWYYLRTIPLRLGDTISLSVHESKRNYQVKCLVSKRERIRTAVGEFSTILIEPRTEEEGMFSGKGGMQIWYSDDERRFPVQIKTRMSFGSVLFQLKGVKS